MDEPRRRTARAGTDVAASVKLALAGEFVRRGLVDEIVVYMAPVVLGDLARGLFNLPPLSRMCDRCEFEWRDVARIGDDLRLTLRPRRGAT